MDIAELDRGSRGLPILLCGQGVQWSQGALQILLGFAYLEGYQASSHWRTISLHYAVLAGRICRVFWTMWFLEGYQSSCEYGCHPAVGLHLNLTQLGRKTFEHTDTQTHKHTDPRTHRQTNPQTHRHPDTRTQDTKHTSLQSPRHTNTQIPEHISTKTPRHTNTQTHKPINAQIR